MQLTKSSTDASPNPREAKVTTPGRGESRGDRKWRHWFDGLSEAIGVLSILIYLVSISLFFVHVYGALFATHSLEYGFLAGFIFLDGIGVLVSIAGIILGFRSYKRLVKAILVLQVPLFLMALIAFIWISRNVIPNLQQSTW